MQYRKDVSGGKTVLIMSGSVKEGDANNLNSVLNSDRTISEIWLHSGGGDAAEGTKIGRVIRNHKLPTRIPSRYQCISSCSIAFLGGIVRRIDNGAAYGVHTFYSSGMFDFLQARFDPSFTPYLGELTPGGVLALKNKNNPNHQLALKVVSDARERHLREWLHRNEQGDALLAADWAVYMSEMGVSRLFLGDVIFNQKSELYKDDADLKDVRALLSEMIKQNESQGMSDAAATDKALTDFVADHYAWASQFRTYMCPTRAQMTRYNVVNVAN